jgi:Vault protein inter-alpha-trypsin domain
MMSMHVRTQNTCVLLVVVLLSAICGVSLGLTFAGNGVVSVSAHTVTTLEQPKPNPKPKSKSKSQMHTQLLQQNNAPPSADDLEDTSVTASVKDQLAPSLGSDLGDPGATILSAPSTPSLLVDSKPLGLATLNISVTFVGPIVEATMVMEFSSTHKTDVEGELIVPLPDAATVSEFAVFIDGEWVEASIVGDTKARAVYSEEKKANRPVNLLQWHGGNAFHTRVFPIQPGSTRTFRLSYVSHLVRMPDASFSFGLPISPSVHIDAIHIQVRGNLEDRNDADTWYPMLCDISPASTTNARPAQPIKHIAFSDSRHTEERIDDHFVSQHVDLRWDHVTKHVKHHLCVWLPPPASSKHAMLDTDPESSVGPEHLSIHVERHDLHEDDMQMRVRSSRSMSLLDFDSMDAPSGDAESDDGNSEYFFGIFVPPPASSKLLAGAIRAHNQQKGGNVPQPTDSRSSSTSTSTHPKPRNLVSNALRSSDVHIRVLWDASLSRLHSDKTASLTFLRAVLQNCAKVARRSGKTGERHTSRRRFHRVFVELYTFRNQPQLVHRFHFTDGNFRPLLRALQSIVYDGATSFRHLPFETAILPGLTSSVPYENRPLAGRSFMLVFSDGFSNMDSYNQASLPHSFAHPVHCIVDSMYANFPLLNRVAMLSGGHILNLQEQTIPTAVRTVLSRTHWMLMSVAHDSRHVTDVVPSAPQLVAQRDMYVGGRLLADKAVITLKFVLNIAADIDSSLALHKRPQHMVHVTLRKSQAQPTNMLLSKLWAQHKISELAMQPNANRFQLAQLGRQFSLVTPATSMVVLTTLAQYVHHKVAPPLSQPEFHQQYIELVKQRTRKDRRRQASKAQHIRQAWGELKQWYRNPGAFRSTHSFIGSSGASSDEFIHSGDEHSDDDDVIVDVDVDASADDDTVQQDTGGASPTFMRSSSHTNSISLDGVHPRTSALISSLIGPATQPAPSTHSKPLMPTRSRLRRKSQLSHSMLDSSMDDEIAVPQHSTNPLPTLLSVSPKILEGVHRAGVKLLGNIAHDPSPTLPIKVSSSVGSSVSPPSKQERAALLSIHSNVVANSIYRSATGRKSLLGKVAAATSTRNFGPVPENVQAHNDAVSIEATTSTLTSSDLDTRTYISAMTKAIADGHDPYVVFLQQRKLYRNDPMFYFDASDLLLRLGDKYRSKGICALTDLVELQISNVQLLRATAYRLHQLAVDISLPSFEEIQERRQHGASSVINVVSDQYAALDLAIVLLEDVLRRHADQARSHQDLANVLSARGRLTLGLMLDSYSSGPSTGHMNVKAPAENADNSDDTKRKDEDSNIEPDQILQRNSSTSAQVSLAIAAIVAQHPYPSRDFQLALRLLHAVVTVPWLQGSSGVTSLTSLLDANQIMAVLERIKGDIQVTTQSDTHHPKSPDSKSDMSLDEFSAIKSKFGKDLIGPMEFDIRISLVRDPANSPFSMRIMEPNGDAVLPSTPFSKSSACVLCDTKDNTKTAQCPVEEYLVHQASSGLYRVQLLMAETTPSTPKQDATAHSGAGELTILHATIITNFGRATEVRRTITLELDHTHNAPIIDIGHVEITDTHDEQRIVLSPTVQPYPGAAIIIGADNMPGASRDAAEQLQPWWPVLLQFLLVVVVIYVFWRRFYRRCRFRFKHNGMGMGTGSTASMSNRHSEMTIVSSKAAAPQ